MMIAVVPLLTIPTPYVAENPTRYQSSPSDLVITEFHYDPPGVDKEREWVELANLGDEPILLEGYGLGDEELPGAGEGMLRFPAGSVIDARNTIVVAQTGTGFRTLFGFNPDYEIADSDTAVPDMILDNQWATGQFALANDGDEIFVTDAQDNYLDALNYGDRLTYFTPSIPLAISGQSIERVPSFCDTDSAVDWHPQQYPTPGKLSMEGTCNEAPDATGGDPPEYRAIGDIQGPGDTSPLLNQVVTFRGVVTGILEDQNASGVIFYTLYVQDVPGLEDGDAATSDAVAVFMGRQQPQYQIGDQVVIKGQVTEYYGLTEIDDTGLSVKVESRSQKKPEPAPLNLPHDPAAASVYLETLEGMLVIADEPLPVLGPTHSGCGFALGSTPETTRPIRHSGLETIIPPILVLYQSDVDCSNLPAVKSGDLVSGTAGPLTYHFEQYKIVQQSVATLQIASEPALEPEPLSSPADDSIRVTTMNLDNLLTPGSDQDAAQIETKKRKLAYTIGRTLGCPELVGVQEVETEALLLELAEAVADICKVSYQVTHLDSADGRGIDVALLSDPRRIEVGEAALHQTCSPLETGIHDSSIQCPEGQDPLFSRPPLEITLQADGELLTLFVNHFKSKRGGERETAPRRLAQAGHVNDLVRSLLIADPQLAVIVMGDFNDFNLSPVWQRLQEGGILVDAMQQVQAEERYSYIFDGVSQLVDGILVSPGLAHRVEMVAVAHVNADYPVTLAADDSLAGLPFYSSDHDPVLLSLSMNSHSSEIESTVMAESTPTLIPTAASPPTAVATATTKAERIESDVEYTEPQDEDGSLRSTLIIGTAMLLLAAIVLWMARRIVK